jgi:antitoxin component of MazEF toxin-antitoxin module
MKTELRQCGDRLVLLLPLELVSELGWEQGDVCECRIEADGLRIVRIETAFDRTMEIARKAMEEYKETLATLAKS